jgi:hypothetical protein
VTEETFPIRLAGRVWVLPHLPFRAIKSIQPALFKIYNEAGGADMTVRSVAALGEAEIEALAKATWLAIAQVDRELTFENFEDLAFSVSDLLSAFPSIAHAAGLRARETPATREASPGEGKSILTT